MARKPKTQPSSEAVTATPVEEPAATNEMSSAPTRQGRKAKAAPPSPAPVSTKVSDNAATNDVVADSDDAAPVDVPRRRGPNRKPTPSAAAAAAPLPKAPTKPGRSRTSRQPEKTIPEPVEESAQNTGSKLPSEGIASADPVPVAADPGSPSDDLQQPLPSLDVPSPPKPAAHWDRARDTVQFDWPAIERTAVEDGPNQGMAKLLIAARAEGANSRWPL